MAVNPFRIDVPQTVLDDLTERLTRTRWPAAAEGAGWSRGTDIDYLRGLLDHWRHRYDWRAHEAGLNRLDHVLVAVNNLPVHAVHQRSGEPAAALVLLHGWPDSFYRYAKVLPLLADLHVVVPSLPGYGFTAHPGMSSARMADVVAGLMSELGYERFAVSGGDVGSAVAEALAHHHAHRLTAVHLTDVPYHHLFAIDPASLTEPEREYLQAGQQWARSEGAYAMLQSTKPMTAAFGLTDSPAGLAAWIVEKLRAWSDCDGDLDRRFTPDEVLTHVMLYWVTGTIGSSFTVYAEHDPQAGGGRVDVPTGVAIFPRDIVPAPRAFGERFFDVRRWTDMPRGGHFAAWEEPRLFADDVRALLTSVTEPQVQRATGA
jgi:pimeloyl-ACP methyl ester carboxylesterase